MCAEKCKHGGLSGPKRPKGDDTELPSGAAEETVATRWPQAHAQIPLGTPKAGTLWLPAPHPHLRGQECRLFLLTRRPLRFPGFLPRTQFWSLTPPGTSRILLPLECSSHIYRFSFNKYLSAYYVWGTNLDAKDIKFLKSHFSVGILRLAVSVSLVSTRSGLLVYS